MNTIFILIDTLRRDYLGYYDNERVQTPTLNKLAQTSTVFDNTYLGSFPCMPARRDIWTGRYEFPWRGWGPLEPDDNDLPGLLKEQGHTSMVVSDHYHMWERGSGNYFFSFSGMEFIRGQENDLWITDPTIPIEYPARPERLAGHALRGSSFARYRRNTAHFRTEKDYFAPQVFQRAKEWVERNRTLDDFFLMIECFDPHEPFDPPFPYNEMYNPNYDGESIIWPTYGEIDMLPEELEQVRALYAGELTMVDKWLGVFLDKVQQLGLMEDTMIVLVTDHGHMLGEHGLMGKPWSDIADSNMYQELAHIPMLIYHPQQAQPGKHIPHLVQPVDLYATVLDAMGVPIPNGTHGCSLLPYILQPGVGEPVREVACYGRFGEAINITDGEWTLFLWPLGGENGPLHWYGRLPPQFGDVQVSADYNGRYYTVEVTRGQMHSALYNLSEDYAQQKNVFEENPEVVIRLTAALKQFWQEIGAPLSQLERLGIM